jgi:ketosteroid isomerase-like protein
MVAALAVVCQFLNSATGGHMNPVTTHIRSCPAGVSRLFILGILLAASVCVVSQDKQQAVNANTGKDEDDIKRLISMYAKAADEADPALASRIWCDSSDDSLINPVGRWHGVEQIMGFYRHEMGEMYSARDLKISGVSVHVYSDAAWAEFNWNFSATRRKEGSSVSFDGMETQIYRKNRDRWCLVHVHYSALPAEKKARTE